jgi:hypothetical protein
VVGSAARRFEAQVEALGLSCHHAAMRRVLVAFLAVLTTTALLPNTPAHADTKDWMGDRHAMPSAYSWLSGEDPTDTYEITIVRGKKSVARVIHDLGAVRKQLGEMTPEQAETYQFDHTSMDDYIGPDVVQVERLGPAVVIFQPYGFTASSRIEGLSSRSLVASFETTVELDTYVTIARRGKVIRQFDVGFKPPAHGALPEEAGLDFGAKHQNIWATAWALNERVTRIHLSQEWFESTHPTYVLGS